MSSNVLTHEELAALREESQRGSTTQDLDLTSTDRTQRKNLAQFERALGRLVTTVQTVLSRALRIACDAQPTPAELVGATAISHILDRNAATVPLHIGDTCVGWLGLPNELCFCLVERSFGGGLPVAANVDEEDEETARWEPGRARLTSLERRTVWPVVESLVAGLGGELTDAPVTVGGGPDDPEPELPELDEALAGSIEVDVAGSKFRLDVVVLSRLRAALGPQNDAPPDERDSLRAQVERAYVEVTSNLGGAELTVSELLALQPGDIVRLDRSQSDPLPVFIETLPKFLARPLQRKGCLALQIETEVL